MLRSFFGILFWILVYSGCAYGAYTFWYVPKFTVTKANSTSKAETVVGVRTALVVFSDYNLNREIAAKVVARKKSVINFRTAGCIHKIYADIEPGDLITRGQNLAKLEGNTAKFDVDEILAKMEQFKARSKEAEISLRVKKETKARVEKAFDQEKTRFSRQKTLFEKNLSTQRVMDEVEKTLQLAQERRDSAADEETLALARQVRLDTELRILETQLARSKMALSDLTLRAPEEARVIKNKLRVGNCVSATTEVLEVYDPSSLEINATIPLILHDKLKSSFESTNVKVRMLEPYSECSSFISGNESASESIGEITYRIPIPKACSARLEYNVRLSFEMPIRALKNIVRLPIEAEKDAGKLFIVENDRLVLQPVKIDARDENWIYVSDGLKLGDKVVTSETGLLLNGIKVKEVDP